MNIRIGQGYDVRQPVEGHGLTLGDVRIPFKKGLLSHPDAGALLHALTGALLGAASLGGIGNHLPNTVAKFKDADSRVLLHEAYQSAQALGWRVVNVDTTIIAQKPRPAPHIPTIRANVATDLSIRTVCVNIKGRTDERLGYLGRMEAIEVQVVALLQKADTP